MILKELKKCDVHPTIDTCFLVRLGVSKKTFIRLNGEPATKSSAILSHQFSAYNGIPCGNFLGDVLSSPAAEEITLLTRALHAILPKSFRSSARNRFRRYAQNRSIGFKSGDLGEIVHKHMSMFNPSHAQQWFDARKTFQTVELRLHLTHHQKTL